MNEKDIYQERKNLFITMTPKVKGVLSLLILLGFGTFVAGMLMQSFERVWGSFLFNFMFFFSLAIGGVAFANMQDVINALWGRPLKRLHESFAAFLPHAFFLLIVYFLCIRFDIFHARHIYSWIHNPHILHDFPGKDIWLTENFMMIRDVVSMFLIVVLSQWHLKMTVKRDLLVVAGKGDEAKAYGLKVKQILNYWSAPVLLAYALLFSILTFDLTMSLAPTWFSTLWPGWCFSMLMHSLMALLLVFMFSLKNTTIGKFFKRQHFHDIGKIMHGFTAFFAYLTFSHIITYWYTNIPEETSYLLTRMKEPWVSLLVVSLFLSFILPIFLLVPKISKWTSFLTLSICGIILSAHVLNNFLVVMPELISPQALGLPWIEGGIFLGYLGLFLFSFFRFSHKVPMVGIGDPLLHDALNDHH